MDKLPLAGYGLIAADCPWTFDQYSTKGETKSAKRHYPTMTTADICALFNPLGLEWCCAPDAAMALWGTWPMMARGDVHMVMRSWGFTAKTGGSWLKLTKHGKKGFGTGYIYRDAGECWLLGTRGEPKALNHSTRNAFYAKLGRHSEKPDRFYDDLERLFIGPRLELFARKPRPGWDAWSNEYEAFGDEEAERAFAESGLAVRPGKFYRDQSGGSKFDRERSRIADRKARKGDGIAKSRKPARRPAKAHRKRGAGVSPVHGP